MLLYESIHTIDVDGGKCVRRTIPEDFAGFINEYIEYATQNESIKYYTIQNESAAVVSYISKIAKVSVAKQENFDKEMCDLDVLSQAIADKLVREEQQAQLKIQPLGQKIKKGSLVQAFIQVDATEYLYIVAKVEHTEYFDGASLRKSFGFPSEKKNIWKSAVFRMNIEQEISFDLVRVYLDNEAKYWTSSFLELSEERDDESNTKTAYKAIDQELKRYVRKKSERDYLILRNAVYQKMRTSRWLNYSEMIHDLLTGYEPDNPELDLPVLEEKLLKLPENKKFDAQFHIVPAALEGKWHLKYQVMSNIELRINGEIDDVKESITACTDEYGNRYIKIKCDEEKTFEAFGGRRL